MSNCVTIDENICKGCGLCVFVCPKKIIRINREKLSPKGYNPAGVIEIEKCIACGMCATICPDSAIKVEKGG